MTINRFVEKYDIDYNTVYVGLYKAHKIPTDHFKSVEYEEADMLSASRNFVLSQLDRVLKRERMLTDKLNKLL